MPVWYRTLSKAPSLARCSDDEADLNVCVCVCVCFLQAKGLSQKDLATKLMIPAKTIQVTRKTILMESD